MGGEDWERSFVLCFIQSTGGQGLDVLFKRGHKPSHAGSVHTRFSHDARGNNAHIQASCRFNVRHPRLLLTNSCCTAAGATASSGVTPSL